MLSLSHYLIKEHVGLLKLKDTYDIFNADTQDQVGIAQEEPGGLVTVLRFLMSKQMLPTKVEVRSKPSDELVFTIRRPFSFFRSKVNVLDAQGNLLGYFKSKLFSIGGGFWVYDKEDKQYAEIKGDWKGWNFKFVTPEGIELGGVTKKWAGLAKELFTSADNYIVTIDEKLSDQPAAKTLLLAAALAIDVVYKETKD